MISKQQVELHFSKNASNYNKYAKVQKKMGNILIDQIFQNRLSTLEVKNILEIGSGTGYITNILTELFPSSQITAIDIAPGMIEQAKNKLKNINFICGDIEEMELTNDYDIIISNATFQWFNKIDSTINKLLNKLNPNGILCFSTFGTSTFCELKNCYEQTSKELQISESINPGQTFLSLEELNGICYATKNKVSEKQYELESNEIFEYEYFNNCKEFLYSLKRIGATNCNKDDPRPSPTFLKRVMKLYDENFRRNDKVKVTYHCLFYKMRRL